MSEVPFAYVHHLVTLPVAVGGTRDARFILDTGIGLTLLSDAFARSSAASRMERRSPAAGCPARR